jgi:hypothetical protein
MAECSIARQIFKCPTWSEWTTPTVATDPTATGTEVTGKTLLDMGTVAGGSNTDAVGLTIEFESNFDDSVFGALKFWIRNLPDKTGHTWAAEFATGAIMPAVSLDAVLAGGSAQTLTGNPWDSGVLAAAAGTEYDATNKRIENIILQLQAGASADTWNQSLSLYECPELIVEVERRDNASTTILPELAGFTSQDRGHLFTKSDVEVMIESASGSWRRLGAIKDEEFSLTLGQEFADWRRGSTLTTFHKAVSDATSMAEFTIYNCDPELLALALQGNSVDDSGKRAVLFDHTGAPCQPGVTETVFVFQWRTLGGHIVRARVPRGVLTMTGAMTPGTTDFSGVTFQVEGLASGASKSLTQIAWSRVPIELATLPLSYIVT